ncbi:MAG: hypothetical protein HY321_21640 [Armatimonadetes bacterium]|nr:hypothetical protein [Armatimonadota bacterium]
MRTIAQVLVLAVAALTLPPLAAQDGKPMVITFGGFGDLSPFTLNGSAAEIQKDGKGALVEGQPVLRLTESREWQGGSAFLTRTIPLANQASFSAAFQFEMTDPKGIGDDDGVGADGLAFVVQTKASNVGGAGAGVGYAGISPSVAVEFDTFNNGEVSGNHVAISINGDTASVAKLPIEKRMNDGGVHYVWVDYDGAKRVVEVRLSTRPERPEAPLLRHEVDLAATLGEPDVYVGFTASTGSAFNNHDIRYLQFVNAFQESGAGQTGPPAPVEKTLRRVDIVQLQDGAVLFGKLIGVDAATLRLEVKGEVKEITRADLHSLVHATLPAGFLVDAKWMEEWGYPEKVRIAPPPPPEGSRNVPPAVPLRAEAPRLDLLQVDDGTVLPGKLVSIDAEEVVFQVLTDVVKVPRGRLCAIQHGVLSAERLPDAPRLEPWSYPEGPKATP